MALVAYSDESDYSEDEETIPTIKSINSEPNKDAQPTNTKQKTDDVAVGINSIVDEDEDIFIAPGPSNSSGNKVGLDLLPEVLGETSSSTFNEADDELTDVPTKETWKYTSEKKDDIAPPSEEVPEMSGVVMSKAMEYALGSSALSGLLRKKKSTNGKVHLLLPSISELDIPDDDIEEDKSFQSDKKSDKPNPSNSGSGLFSVLPQPKSSVKGKEANRSLVPHILSNKKRQPVKPTQKVKPKPKISEEIVDSDEEDKESDSQIDFFSLDDKLELPPVPIMTPEAPPKVPDNSIVNLVQEDPPPVNIATDNSHSFSENNSNHISIEEQSGMIDMNNIDDEAFRRLTGKKRRRDEPIIGDIIDVSLDDALMSKEQMMLRNLTEVKPMSQSKKKTGEGPSLQQKKKHQIMYLAHQAKEREIELQNDWSAGRAKKMQAREKYGF